MLKYFSVKCGSDNLAKKTNPYVERPIGFNHLIVIPIQNVIDCSCAESVTVTPFVFILLPNIVET